MERTGFHAVIVPQEGKEGIGARTGEGSEPVRSRRWVARTAACSLLPSARSSVTREKGGPIPRWGPALEVGVALRR